MVNFLNRIPTLVLVFALLILSLGIRLVYITATDIAGDEPFSIFISQLDISWIIEHLGTGNNPPLFEILLHYYMMCFGDSDLVLRLLPTVLNALIVIPIYLTGQRFFNRKVALTAALLFVFSIWHIRFAHEIRVYSLFSLTNSCILYFFLSTVQNPTRLGSWVALIICNVILLYSHFTSFYVILVEVLCGLLFMPRYGWKYLFGSLTLTGIFYFPYLMTFLQRLGDVVSVGTWVVKPGWGEIYGSINLMLNERFTTILVIAILILGLICSFKKKLLKMVGRMMSDNFGITIVVWFILPYSLMFLVSMFYIPMFMDRYLLYTSIPLFLTVAWVVDQIWGNTRFHWLGGALLVAASVLTTDINPDNYRRIKSAADYVKQRNDDTTQVYICPEFNDLAFAYHYNRDWFRSYEMSFREIPKLSVDSIMKSNGIFLIRGYDQVDWEKCERTIYLDAASDFTFPNNGILDSLKSKMTLVDSSHFYQIFNVYLFEKDSLTSTK